MKTIATIGFVLVYLRIWIGINFEPEPFHLLQAYKDIAHVFIGGLGVAWYYSKEHWQWHLFWFMCGVEITTAIITRLW
jgi:hypothetical protein